MSRPVQYNNTVKFAGIPEGYMGDGFMATSFEKVVGLNPSPIYPSGIPANFTVLLYCTGRDIYC